LRQDHLLLLQVVDCEPEDRTVRYRFVTESLQVGLSEGTFPGERLALDLPRPVAVAGALDGVRELQGGGRHLVVGHGSQ